MSNHLGDYLKARREQLGLRRSEVARLLGYENAGKGSARLNSLEEGRWVSQDFLLRLMGVLQIEPQVVQELIDRDRQEYVAAWNKWADEPVPMHAAVRYIPGFFAGIDLPGDVTRPEQALAWAVETAQQKNKKIVLVISRRESWTVHEDGRADGPFVATPDEKAQPWMALGKTPFLPGLGRSENITSDDRSRQ
jgi:transcriptional regulator with XRE-family HTH domain